MNRATRNEIINLVDQAIKPIEQECIEVEWVAGEKILRIFIDSPHGIDMDDCLQANQIVSEIEAIDSMIPGQYRLEVSSPGVDRPLRTLAHFEQVIGETIRVKLIEKVDNSKQGSGQLLGVDDLSTLRIARENGEWHVPIKLLNYANLVYDWN